MKDHMIKIQIYGKVFKRGAGFTWTPLYIAYLRLSAVMLAFPHKDGPELYELHVGCGSWGQTLFVKAKDFERAIKDTSPDHLLSEAERRKQ